MSKIIPFKAVRPSPDKVGLVTCRNYEDYSAAEIAAWFLRAAKRRDPDRRRRHFTHAVSRNAPDPPQAADDLPGPLCLSRPPAAGQGHCDGAETRSGRGQAQPARTP